MKSLMLTILSATLLLVVPYASAQQGTDNRIPTNLPGVFTYPSPPSGFDPLTASDDQLAYRPGLPDKNAEGPYASWEKAMKVQHCGSSPQSHQPLPRAEYCGRQSRKQFGYVQ